MWLFYVAELPAEMNEAANPGTMEAALLDLALLSTCDDMVVTVASSFGWVAGRAARAFPQQCALFSTSHLLYYQEFRSKPGPQIPWQKCDLVTFGHCSGHGRRGSSTHVIWRAYVLTKPALLQVGDVPLPT